MTEKRGFVKIDAPAIEIPDFDTFTIMGDPGCDGLGVEIMNTFARALKSTKPGFAVILGDLVPIGEREVYDAVYQFTKIVADYPVYALCGNHDTKFYEEFFGLKDYILYNNRSAIIVLDNSKRRFSDTTIDFLRNSLEKYERENIMLLFHIPPPNRFSSNTMSAEEWGKLNAVLDLFPGRISFILCGHIHTFFEDNLEGIRLIVSAGAGARLEEVHGPIEKMKAFHHVLRFYYDDAGKLSYEHITLDGIYYENEIADKELKAMLREDFTKKSEMYITAKLFAHDAEEKGLFNMAKFFRAVSNSAYYHARNHFTNLNYLRTVSENAYSLKKIKERDIDTIYRKNIQYAEKKQLGLARYSFIDMEQAEKTQLGHFSSVLSFLKEGKDIEPSKYFTCSSCGNTVIGDEVPLNCPLCGAPRDKIYQVV